MDWPFASDLGGCSLYIAGECRHAGRIYGRSGMLGIPAKQELGSRPANTPLARSHATSCMQFGFAPRMPRVECVPGSRLGAADECLRRGKLIQLVPGGE